MRVHDLLQQAGLPTLVLVGLGAGAAAANFGTADRIPAELAGVSHCRVADIPTQVQSPDAMKAYEEAEPPLWTDLDGTDAPGIQIAVLSDGVDGWIVAQWNVEVFGTEQAEVFQIWIGLSTDANPGQDISWAYGPGSPTDPLLDFLVGAENVLGAGEMAAALPTGPQVVTSTDPVPGDVASYTLEITGTRAGEADVVTEMTASLVPGVTVARSTINVLSN